MAERYDHNAPETRLRRRVLMICMPLIPIVLLPDEIAETVNAVRSDAPESAELLLQTAAVTTAWLLLLIVVFSSRPIARNDPPFAWSAVAAVVLGPLFAYTFASSVGLIAGVTIGLVLTVLLMFGGWRSHAVRQQELRGVSA